ncbi:unnamed protein product [Vitrella brassicaformis CCMP3155]|uniref:Thioredoxin domain-containing protein n=1 Tax=Vitrella brassicaformis (strain CCMP3155) TaxID=1169540 RepID=A0A0G4G9A7_VITBC|nr:unnamed protein product [Vitrella brassicaformis CCMP3155]|eukprot:CEM25460.1 unnamed protein product [Vitrella brassicaformis CCMP3155]
MTPFHRSFGFLGLAASSAVLLLLLLCLGWCEVAVAVRRTVVLNKYNMEQHLKNKPYFVKFFAPWCSHCQKLAPIWDQLAEEVHRERLDFSVGEVDCDKYREICEDYHVEGYPTLILAVDGDRYVYDEEREATALKKWAVATLKRHRQKVMARAYDDAKRADKQRREAAAKETAQLGAAKTFYEASIRALTVYLHVLLAVVLIVVGMSLWIVVSEIIEHRKNAAWYSEIKVRPAGTSLSPPPTADDARLPTTAGPANVPVTTISSSTQQSDSHATGGVVRERGHGAGGQGGGSDPGGAGGGTRSSSTAER